MIDSNSDDAPRLMRPSALERELAESLRRSIGIIPSTVVSTTTHTDRIFAVPPSRSA